MVLGVLRYAMVFEISWYLMGVLIASGGPVLKNNIPPRKKCEEEKPPCKIESQESCQERRSKVRYLVLLHFFPTVLLPSDAPIGKFSVTVPNSPMLE